MKNIVAYLVNNFKRKEPTVQFISVSGTTYDMKTNFKNYNKLTVNNFGIYDRIDRYHNWVGDGIAQAEATVRIQDYNPSTGILTIYKSSNEISALTISVYGAIRK